MLNKLITGIIFVSFNSFSVETMNTARYSAYFKTISSSCILSVNGLDYLSTLKGSRNIITGSDITESLENNKTNTIGIIFFPSKSKIKTETYTCEIKVVKSLPSKQDEVITNFRIVFNGKNNRPFNVSQGYSIEDISDTTKNPIIKGISNRIIFAGEEKPEDWLIASRNFTVSHIPEWEWTKSPSQINDINLRTQLISIYKELINDLNSGDLETIKKKYSLALNEYTKSDLTDDPELFFNSIGIVNAVQKGKVNLNPDWNKYKTLMYQNNRTFCLGIGGASRNSPIQFFNDKGKRIFSWNPFFAMIDGKLVLVR